MFTQFVVQFVIIFWNVSRIIRTCGAVPFIVVLAKTECWKSIVQYKELNNFNDFLNRIKKGIKLIVRLQQYRKGNV